MQKHAHPNTVYHCLYSYFFLGISKIHLAKIYCKSPSTITSWIEKFEKDGAIGRNTNVSNVYKKFGIEKRRWLIDTYQKNPILYQEEAASLFYNMFHISISTSTISLILREAGLSWKVLEQRAIQIQIADVVRFCTELTTFPWLLENLVFIDEVSFNGRDMIRRKGYGVKGEKLVFRADFSRKARISLLCFLGVHGILNTYVTDGTFTRLKFLECCKRFALEYDSPVKQHPGPNSVFIFDGAKIHCHAKLIEYLRSLGIIPVFLPAYCPFFNPIEFVFGLVKRRLKKTNDLQIKKDAQIHISEVFNEFMGRNCKNLFRKCGYMPNGTFDPSIGMSQDLQFYGFRETI